MSKGVIVGIIIGLIIIGVVGFFSFNSNSSEKTQTDRLKEEVTLGGETVEKNTADNNIPAKSAAEILSFSWEEDSGSRITGGSVPFVHKLNDGKVRLYYCSGDEGILSAISSDGLTFAKEQSVRI